MKMKTFIYSIGILLVTFYSCTKDSTRYESGSETFTDYNSNFLKNEIQLSDFKSQMQENLSLYQKKSLKDILTDLVDKNILSNESKENITESIEGKSLSEFREQALIRAMSRSSNRYKQLNIKMSNGDLDVPDTPAEPVLSDEIAEEVFDYMILDLSSRGISWGCAGAIAGYGLSIAGAFIGGPVTIAAAAIWGASHIVAVVSLTACARDEKAVLEEIALEPEDGFISDFENTYMGNEDAEDTP